MLYFIKSGNYCKIGYSRDLKALFTRLRNYLTHNPSFQILDLRSGDKMRESQIHSLIPPEYTIMVSGVFGINRLQSFGCVSIKSNQKKL
ncbi:hypothetical protein CIK98_06720 [Prevotella sp. P2-180]|nr:hypothetical protein CIK98_06720 [Prevotella sp. P2-180]